MEWCAVQYIAIIMRTVCFSRATLLLDGPEAAVLTSFPHIFFKSQYRRKENILSLFLPYGIHHF